MKVSTIQTFYIPNQSNGYLFATLADCYLSLGWINVGWKIFQIAALVWSWLQLSGVRRIQLLREIQAEVMNKIQAPLFVSTAQDVHLITILAMKCP